jgi:hypothetical protein
MVNGKKSPSDGIVGIGHPDFLDARKLLSKDDEKSIDEKGNKVIDGDLWSASATGLYLILFGYKGGGTFGQATGTIGLGNGLSLMVGSGTGKPTFPIAGWGASLELPADLARDDLKRQYVTEWVIDTAKEILTGAESFIPGDATNEFAAWLMGSTERAIRETGL